MLYKFNLCVICTICYISLIQTGYVWNLLIFARTYLLVTEAFLPADGIDPAIVYRKTDGLEVDCYVPLFLKVC